MKAILLVALGGALGALARLGVVSLVGATWPKTRLPWGILAANLAGCLAIGIIFGLAENRNWFTEPARLIVLVGFLGSFTTFSTFGWNTFELFRTGHAALAFANVAISVLGGLAAVWAGWAMAR